MRPAEVASPLAAPRIPVKRRFTSGRCQTGTDKRQCSGKLLDRYPTLPNGTREGCFSANRTGKDAPANTGQAARRYAIDSSPPDHVFKKKFCSPDSSIAWLLLQK